MADLLQYCCITRLCSFFLRKMSRGFQILPFLISLYILPLPILYNVHVELDHCGAHHHAGSDHDGNQHGPEYETDCNLCDLFFIDEALTLNFNIFTEPPFWSIAKLFFDSGFVRTYNHYVSLRGPPFC